MNDRRLHSPEILYAIQNWMKLITSVHCQDEVVTRRALKQLSAYRGVGLDEVDGFFETLDQREQEPQSAAIPSSPELLERARNLLTLVGNTAIAPEYRAHAVRHLETLRGSHIPDVDAHFKRVDDLAKHAALKATWHRHRNNTSTETDAAASVTDARAR